MSIRRLAIIFIAIIIIGYNCGKYVHASGITPGSADDPVVTVGYVQNYLKDTISPIETKLTLVEEKVNNIAEQTKQIQKSINSKITLIIGKKIAKIGSKSVTLESPPQVYKGKTILPLRFVGQALHAQVLWEAKAKSITYIVGSKKIILQVNSSKAIINDKEVKLDVAPVLQGATVLVPVRFVGENLDASVQYIAASKTIIIRER
jgi:hypothetical protein